LASYRPWGHKELDTTEQLSTAQHSTAFIRYLSEPDPELNICAMQSLLWGFPRGSAVKNLPAKEGEVDSILESGRSLGKEAPIFLPGKSHKQRSLQVQSTGFFGSSVVSLTWQEFRTEEGLQRSEYKTWFYRSFAILLFQH